jgi:hypothetical protein
VTFVFEGAWDISRRLGPLHEAREIADIHRIGAADSGSEPVSH